MAVSRALPMVLQERSGDCCPASAQLLLPIWAMVLHMFPVDASNSAQLCYD
jgi:hypothetical protein